MSVGLDRHDYEILFDSRVIEAREHINDIVSNYNVIQEAQTLDSLKELTELVEKLHEIWETKMGFEKEELGKELESYTLPGEKEVLDNLDDIKLKEEK